MDITPETPVRRWLNVSTAILVGAVVISGSILYVGSGNGTASTLKTAQGGTAAVSNAPTPVKDPSTLFGPADAVLGNQNAAVTVVEFSDFQCPFCRQFFVQTFAQLKHDYIDTGKVRFIYRNFPLPFHSAAKPAALAGLCAKDQNKFWELHDTIFNEQQKQEADPKVVTKTVDFGVADLKKWAGQVGLNTAQFNQCLDGATHQAQVDADTQAGSDAGVSGTPSFFINGKILVGAQPFSSFKAAIDAALKK